MGSWICDYLARPQFAEITSELGTISHLYLYSLVIGLVVMMSVSRHHLDCAESHLQAYASTRIRNEKKP